MSIEPEGWHMDPSPPSWDPEAKTFSFFLHKPNKKQADRVETLLFAGDEVLREFSQAGNWCKIPPMP
jgi:hypothetical protein